MNSGSTPFYLYHSGHFLFIILGAGSIAVIALLSNGFRLRSTEGDTIKTSDLLIFCLWAIGPPLWFLFEYVWIYSTYPYKNHPSYFDDFKYIQKLAGDFWIAVFVINTFILYIKYGKKIG